MDALLFLCFFAVFSISEMAYLAHELNNANDIVGNSLLASCTIMSGSEVGDGRKHTHNDMPF